MTCTNKLQPVDLFICLFLVSYAYKKKVSNNWYYPHNSVLKSVLTTAYLCCGGHSTSINACRVQKVRAKIQVFKKELYTHIHLDYTRVEIISCIYILKEKKKKHSPINCYSPNMSPNKLQLWK